jgi:hypothetical protein
MLTTGAAAPLAAALAVVVAWAGPRACLVG